MICLNLKVTENVLLISGWDWVICLNLKITENVLLISAMSGLQSGIG